MKTEMKTPSNANARRMVDEIVRTILKGDKFREAVAARSKLPKRFSGKTGVVYRPEWQDI